MVACGADLQEAKFYIHLYVCNICNMFINFILYYINLYFIIIILSLLSYINIIFDYIIIFIILTLYVTLTTVCWGFKPKEMFTNGFWRGEGKGQSINFFYFNHFPSQSPPPTPLCYCHRMSMSMTHGFHCKNVSLLTMVGLTLLLF